MKMDPIVSGLHTPTIKVIKTYLMTFTRIDTDDAWYTTDYLRSEDDRLIISNIQKDLQRRHLNIDSIFNKKDITDSIKTHRMDAFYFFYNVLHKFHEFLQSGELAWNTMDTSHAQVIASLIKWENRGIGLDVPELYNLWDVEGDTFLIVRNTENASVESTECQARRHAYKSLEDELHYEMSMHMDHRVLIDNIAALLHSTSPTSNWTNEELSMFRRIRNSRIEHAKLCVKYTGDKRFISSSLFSVINSLCNTLISCERMLRQMGVI